MSVHDTKLQGETEGYFAQAQQWFLKTYVSIYSFYFYCIIVTAFSLFTLFIALTELSNNYSSIKVLLPILNNDSINKVHRVEKLSTTFNQPKFTMLNHILHKYILKREGFDPNILNDETVLHSINMISGMSSHQVFSQYLTVLKNNLNNPRKRNVIIQKIVFDTKYNNLATAYISLDGQKFIIHIKFTVAELEDIIRYDTDLNFLILEYRKTILE